jgi:hypothetical protein
MALFYRANDTAGMKYRRNLAAFLTFHREDRKVVQEQGWRGISLNPG